jgi:predicted pyridoxine 5'-phosphate oxidase superfamily flavin-nucleotide-binding protein
LLAKPFTNVDRYIGSLPHPPPETTTMKPLTSDIAFTPTVKAIQQRLGSRQTYERMKQGRGWQKHVSPELAEFIAERDTFFLGTTSADGQPYIQHRGGPPGFLKVIDEETLAFADFRGNRQYLTMGNLEDNEKAFIFLIDFVNRRRIKIWGRASVVEDQPELLESLSDPDYQAKLERVILFHIDAWDINCPQHITRRYTVEEFADRK